MGFWGAGLGWFDAGLREILLFAAIGFLIGGLDDLAVDIVYLGNRMATWLRPRRPRYALLSALPSPAVPRHFAIFVAAWDEAAVIGPMLRNALARLDGADFTIHVGTYPNDPATIAAVGAIAAADARVRLVIGAAPGPTTKADCLNTIWRSLARDEAAGARRAAGIVIHDAEDVVHGAELTVFDALLDQHAVVQLPVLPLVSRRSPLVAGTYLDEFAEAHAKSLVVRRALGAGMPLAGTGCAIRREVLDALATTRGGAPFDPASLVEDYEMGLAIAALGGSGIIARIREARGRPLVAVRAFFPDTLHAAVRQKARWMMGIALAGWDRVGWGRALDWRDHWMRMRDRRAALAMIVLAAAYAALVMWAASMLAHWTLGGAAPAPAGLLRWALVANLVLLGWRLLWRMAFTWRAYGFRQALLALPRAPVGNLIALLAARRALTDYVRALGGRPKGWDKTRHRFPIEGEVDPA